MATAPIFTKEMCNCETCEGSGVMFEVKIEGAEEVVWQCEGENIDFEEEKRYTTEEEDDGVYKLLISEVDVDDTDCAFQCVAKNAAGQTISEAKVFVEEMPEHVKELIQMKEHKQ
ncbi:telokin-like isoform X2 [Amphiura filiformis]|uniref:telokin-like isoform X2 n=1 Tax=Amphiura filiformis TaxID=82378 RepID=UPI003B21E37B